MVPVTSLEHQPRYSEMLDNDPPFGVPVTTSADLLHNVKICYLRKNINFGRAPRDVRPLTSPFLLGVALRHTHRQIETGFFERWYVWPAGCPLFSPRHQEPQLPGVDEFCPRTCGADSIEVSTEKCVKRFGIASIRDMRPLNATQLCYPLHCDVLHGANTRRGVIDLPRICFRILEKFLEGPPR